MLSENAAHMMRLMRNGDSKALFFGQNHGERSRIGLSYLCTETFNNATKYLKSIKLLKSILCIRTDNITVGYISQYFFIRLSSDWITFFYFIFI